ncbi:MULTISPECIES: fumarylacetoacetate hydrolase family protein [Auritidibacter]|uniref:fumarylacetoacetate hydrolase family protein n=1 Tax=Auritidibacter TaxID=1160973 RepID=UPI000D73EFC2|nr:MULTISPECIES: fumarylacetoacetate hydrolase family protein [Auritidibacter]PXA81652.1 2-hydroxyhepta-2,4-diene-1,7-dioate isomerase [Auritidibacter sp. NML120779]AXR73281.1 FAA hydrolase family protein [Auritidibacter sp. NML130574]NIH70953.1 2-keto-4-pentenoate hydratase/2-oxohepta-3-ene-1,7-dioic acid hydratase in catechol pathway [Auritidibacter ignavus]PXA82036.1 2-hydroxyhepta-2,4-diene-1,7-dioate isomerase [Auritidibacter sp. NML120636]RMX24117.1 FAA hydrolase family protein [Auritidi
MRIARAVIDDQPTFGLVDDATFTEIHGDPFYQGIQPTSTTHQVADIRLVAPIIPRSKIIGVGRNYLDHAHELGNEVPTVPMLFFKPNTTVVGPGDPVTLPSWSEEVSYEAELAVVIGRICKEVPVEKVPEVVFGYTVANDLTARDIQRAENQWARAKGFDGSCPLGPWIETELDVEDAEVRSSVNGEVRQEGNTSQMVFGVADLVAEISRAFTLLPGDVILTGTPAGVGTIEDGDRVECEVEGIGTLTTLIRR